MVPVAVAAAGSFIHRPHWTFLVSLVWAFLVLLSLIHSLATGCIEDNWGRIARSEHPVRFWIQIGIWLTAFTLASAFPLAFALHQLAP